MYYDRSVSDALLDALSSKGPFARLAHFARTHHLADLQLRGYPGDPHKWATLYVGLTKVLDVHERHGQFWLKGPAADLAWVQRQPVEYWFGLEERLDHQVWSEIGRVRQSFTREGAVQAMLCTRASDLFSVVDRETVIGFPSTADREATYDRLQAPLRDAFPTPPSAPWLAPKKFGGELDLLAVDPDGRLLAIEIKPGSATAGITWAPLQATFYARLLQAWADEAGPESATIVERMLGQRVSLNLTADPIRPVRVPLEIVPVVAISPGFSKAALERLHVVQERLLGAGVGISALEVWEVRDTVERRVLIDNGTNDVRAM